MLSEVLRGWRKTAAAVTPMADPGEVADALVKFDPLWEQLTTWEQETFIRTLVAQVRYDGRTGEVTVGFHSEGIKQLCSQAAEKLNEFQRAARDSFHLRTKPRPASESGEPIPTKSRAAAANHAGARAGDSSRRHDSAG